jgi:hypothetical protein
MDTQRRSRSHRRRILAPGTGATVYILDEFTTDDPAPVSSPRTCEPGPGLALVTDTAGTNTSITSGSLTLVGTGSFNGSAVAFTQPDGSAVPRLPGTRIEVDVKIPANDAFFFIGLQTTTDPQGAPTNAAVIYALRFDSSETIDVYVYDGSGSATAENAGAWVANTAYRVRLTLRAAGCTFQISGGAFGTLGETWTTLYNSDQLTNTPLFPAINMRLAPAAAFAQVKAYRPA